LAELALLHSLGQDLGHQIRDVIGQVLSGEVAGSGLLAEV
jgi:hypothetical protein